ncbi:MAG: Pantothenate synthetase [Alphaproteobacteria bacterium MarineAlpha8_Bin1]|nr:MAG: Pantothenate synthetase [Alphaproteobacteria bacterium MarineAlpha8_Bin1]|tara:strand:- start:42 stop:908 length:867 start_codon:yes stop_codon:yes gene_type:complete
MTKIIWHSKTLEKEIKILHNSKINFIPTMGNLHDGHLSLIKAAKKNSFFNIVSIFVNPLQFNEKKDFINYPRTLKKDIKILKDLNVDFIFIPEKKFSSIEIEFSKIKYLNKLCAIDRPGHFEGVAKIIYKFLRLINPDLIFLGKKDYQQILVIENLIEEFEFNTAIKKLPIVREKSGLALSSRNNLISKDKLNSTKFIFKILKNLSEKIINEGLFLYEIDHFQKEIINHGADKLNYLEILNSKDLSSINSRPCKAIIFISAEFDGVKLIDNLEIKGKIKLCEEKIISF